MKETFLFYNFIGFMTLLRREIHRFMKVPIQTVVAPLLSNILFLGIFGGVLKTRDVGIEGVSYLSFLVPGLISMGALTAAFQNPSFSIVSQKFQSTIQDLNSYPISDTEKTLAFILGGVFRGILVGTLTYIATIPFVGYTIDNPLAFVAAMFIVSFIFASFGLIVGLFIENFEKMNFVLAIVITPLTYLGGVFFEVSKLPGILAYTRYINPIYPLVNMTRYAYLGQSEGNVIIHAAIAVVILAVIYLTARHCFKKGYGIKVN